MRRERKKLFRHRQIIKIILCPLQKEKEKEVEEVSEEEVAVVRTEEVQIDARRRHCSSVAGALAGAEAAGGGQVGQGPAVARVQEEPQREGEQGGGEKVSWTATAR